MRTERAAGSTGRGDATQIHINKERRLRELAMKLFGKTLGDYLRFGRGILILTAVVGLLRLGLSLAGAPTDVAFWFSVSALMLVSMVYFPIVVRVTGFGGYRHVLVLLALQIFVAEFIVSVGIAITAVTGVTNIFSIPEFSGTLESHWIHALTHLVLGPTLFALILWIPASIIYWVTGLVVGPKKAA
jgi:hypothetical protein